MCVETIKPQPEEKRRGRGRPAGVKNGEGKSARWSARIDFEALSRDFRMDKLIKRDRAQEERVEQCEAAVRQAAVVWNYPPARLARPKGPRADMLKSALNNLAHRTQVYAPDWWLFAMQERDIGAAEFRAWRRDHMFMNQAQAAGFFRVPVSTIAQWEKGRLMIPFSAAFMMRHFRDDPAVQLTRPGFQDWTVIYDFDAKKPMLYNKEFRVGFTPDYLIWYRMRLDAASRQEHENGQLRAQLEAAQAENSKLRKMFKEHAVTKELEAMHARLAELFAQVRPADVIDFPAPKAAAA